MKIFSNSNFAIAVFLLLLPTSSLAWGQDRADRQRQNVQRLINRVGKISPKLKQYVEDFGDDGESDDEIAEMCREFLDEYDEIKSESGKKLAMHWSQLAIAEFEVHRAILQAEDDGLDEDVLKEKFLKLIDAEIDFATAETNQLDDKEERQERREELQERRENREEEAEDAMEELLRELEGADRDWDHEEDDEVEDVEETNKNYRPVQSLKLSTNEIAMASHWDFKARVLPVLTQACYDCHGGGSNEGNLDIESLLNETPLVKNRERWSHVIAQIENRTMPPPDANEVSELERKIIAAWLRDQLENFNFDLIRNPGYESAKRLTHEEYNNTVRDLIGIDFRPADRLPTDMSTNRGFDNSANSLFLNDGLLERYLGLAEHIVQNAYPTKNRNQEQEQAWRKLFVQTPSPKSETETARAVLENFLSRAYRTKVEADEVEAMVRRFRKYRDTESSFYTAILKCVQASLVSPRFLLRVEKNRPKTDQAIKVDAYALANRLSYFIWASMPDERLFQLAESGQLLDAKTLRSEVKRMLHDPKASTLGSSFAGQWLGFEHLGSRIRLDPIDNPWCTDSLMDAMKSETAMFFVSLIRENRPLHELIDPEYTFLNEELARFYWMRNVQGQKMRRVLLDSKNRGGIFGQSSILAVTSFPDRTSPVTRGAWVLTNVLGKRPPNPPPNASQFNEELEERDSLTQRQKMELHRRKPICAACHDQIDPLGFALENYDLFGRYRSRSEEGRKIDSQAELPDGTKLNGIAGLKRYIVDQKLKDVLRQLTRKMLAYALGRQLEFYDERAVGKIVNAVIADNWRLETLVLEITESFPFQYKQIQD